MYTVHSLYKEWVWEKVCYFKNLCKQKRYSMELTAKSRNFQIVSIDVYPRLLTESVADITVTSIFHALGNKQIEN